MPIAFTSRRANTFARLNMSECTRTVGMLTHEHTLRNCFSDLNNRKQREFTMNSQPKTNGVIYNLCQIYCLARCNSASTVSTMIDSFNPMHGQANENPWGKLPRACRHCYYTHHVIIYSARSHSDSSHHIDAYRKFKLHNVCSRTQIITDGRPLKRHPSLAYCRVNCPETSNELTTCMAAALIDKLFAMFERCRCPIPRKCRLYTIQNWQPLINRYLDERENL